MVLSKNYLLVSRDRTAESAIVHVDVSNPVLVHVSPHPDDEVLGAGATLSALRDAGWRVINLACSLGRPADRERRRQELSAALDRLGFEGRELSPSLGLGVDDDMAEAEARIAATVKELIQATGAKLVVSPHQYDRHHGHEAVANAVAQVVHDTPGLTWWTWGLWVDLPRPNLYHAFDGSRLMRVISAMEAHEGENARNPYVDLIPVRARATAILGSERVFGFGTPAASPFPYAEVLTELCLVKGELLPGPARLLDPQCPLAP